MTFCWVLKKSLSVFDFPQQWLVATLKQSKQNKNKNIEKCKQKADKKMVKI